MDIHRHYAGLARVDEHGTPLDRRRLGHEAPGLPPEGAAREATAIVDVARFMLGCVYAMLTERRPFLLHPRDS